MSIFRAGGLARTGIKKLVPLMGLLALVASQHAAAVNLIDPDDHDWRWELGAEPTFPNECYGEGDLCLVDTDDNDADKANDGDNQLFDVWVPDGAGPFPIFIHAHGGGFTGGSKKRMALAGPLLANDDVVFVTTNYRLEGQTPEGVLKSIDDVIALIELLKTDEKYKVNPDQIFIGGGSAGGVITNYIAYNEKVTGIKGLWHWNLYEDEGQAVDLQDPVLLANVPLPIVHAHPDPYPEDNSHSATDAFDHAKANWGVGNRSTFFHAENEHPSMIGYETPYSFIDQIWTDGVWELDYRDGTDTGVKMLNLAEWIYDNLSPSPDGQVSDEELLVDIQQLYIGILGRAADQPGLDYWEAEITSGSLTLENTRASFTQQPEYTAIYDGLNNTQLVTLIYQNFLERDPDSSGLNYWVAELDSGSVNPDQMVNAIINAVEDTTDTDSQRLVDRSVLMNKVTVATYFTSAFSTATVDADYLTTAQQAIADVDDSSDSVTSATTYVNSALDGLSSSPWIVNSDGTRSQFIFEANSNLGVLVNLQSTEEVVLSGETYTYVEATGVPSYSVQLSQTEIDALNNRPNAATDFISGSTTATTENAVAFGQDIGFQSRSSCNTNGGFGYWPPGPECPENVSHQSSFNTNPSANSSSCETGLGTMGLYVNGTAIFNWGDGQSYNSQGAWQNLAPIAEQYDVDICGGHAAAGEYHHHFYSSCLADLVGDTGSGHSPIYGFAADGYAMHGPWHASEVLAISAWAIRDYSAGSSTGCSSEGERSCALVDPYDVGQGVQASSSGPSITTNVNTLSGNTLLAYAGFYYEDYYWDSSLTSQGGEYLDQYNGHDHDELGYHYHMTVTQGGDSSLTPSFPFTIGPRFRGQLDSEALTSCATSGGPGGSPP